VEIPGQFSAEINTRFIPSATNKAQNATATMLSSLMPTALELIHSRGCD
jgi:hypothetical protein